MKFSKVIIGILAVVLLIATTTLFLAYQTLNYSFLSYDENINALNEINYKSYIIEQLAKNQLGDIEGLDELIENTSIKDLNLGSINYFINTSIENSLMYLLLKSDQLAPFDKRFVTEYKNNSVAAVIDPLLNIGIFGSITENLDQVDPEIAKRALIEIFKNKDISYTNDEVDAIIDSLYDGSPTKDKLRDELTKFVGNKIVIDFHPEKIVKRVLTMPRLAIFQLAHVVGQLVLIEMGLLLLLIIVLFFSKRGIMNSLLLTSIGTLLAYQSLRLARSSMVLEQTAQDGLLQDYYDYMSQLLIGHVNYVSVAMVLLIIVLFVIKGLFAKSSSKKNIHNESRFKLPRFIIASILVVAISYFGYTIYTESYQTYQTIEKYDIEKDLNNFDEVFKFDFQL